MDVHDERSRVRLERDEALVGALALAVRVDRAVEDEAEESAAELLPVRDAIRLLVGTGGEIDRDALIHRRSGVVAEVGLLRGGVVQAVRAEERATGSAFSTQPVLEDRAGTRRSDDAGQVVAAVELVAHGVQATDACAELLLRGEGQDGGGGEDDGHGASCWADGKVTELRGGVNNAELCAGFVLYFLCMVKGHGAKPLSRSLKVYQRIAVAFVFVTFFLLLAVLYLSVSRATIHIVADPRVVSVDSQVEAVADPVEEGELTGVIVEQTFTGSKNFMLPSEGAVAVEEKAGGMVTIINETGGAQQLVATTRLLSEEGVLFRIDSGVTVPANGQIDVMAHADQPGLSGEIGPTQFTIPGLPQSIQDEIYAVSVESMAGGVAYRRVLTEKDIQDGISALSDELLSQAKSTLSMNIDRAIFTGESYIVDVASQSSDQTVGAEVSSFNATVSVDVTAVYYSSEDIRTYAKGQLNERVPEGFAIHSINEDGFQVTVESADARNGSAQLGIYLEGTAAISEDSSVLSKDRFVGRAPNEVITLLQSSDAIREASVNFTPFWLQRVPTLKDHIKIEIEIPENEE